MTTKKESLLDQAIFINRTKLLFEQYLIGFISTIAVASVTLIVLWDTSNSLNLLIWFVTVLCILSVRLYIVYGTNKHFSSDYQGWHRRYKAFLMSAFLLGCTWGLLGTYFLPKEINAHQAFIIVILAGMSSGALPLMFQVNKVFMAFVVPILIPLAILLMFKDEKVYHGISFLILFYFTGMYLVAKRGENSVIEAIKLRFENIDLIEELKLAKDDLTSSRDDLELRVDARTKELVVVSEELSQQKDLAETTLKSIADGIVTTNAYGEILNMNASAESLTGYKQADAAGLMSSECIKLIDEKDNELIQDQVQIALKEKKTIYNSNQCLLLTKSNSTVAIKSSIAPIFDVNRDIQGTVIVLHNINKERMFQLQLTHQANHDALTGLYNRFAFEEYLEQLLNDDKSKQKQHAIIYIDLDDFKIVNDTCGHAAGDELLRQLALIMPISIPSKDMLARLGGDEFGVIIRGMDADGSIQICENLLKQMREFRFAWQDKTFNIGASIGLFIFTTESQTIENIMSVADIACFTAKEHGRNRIHVYSREDQELTYRKNELNWISRIGEAIEKDRLVLYSQPIIDTNDINGPVTHIEILLRMIDEDNGILPPGPFISAAERYHMMPQVDRWVINKVFEHYKQGELDFTSDDFLISINLSGISLADDGLLLYIKNLLAESKFPANHLCFEITETATISNMSIAIKFINSMRELGCKFSIDDFGSGLSSLTYLKNLPVDYVKIDGSFVRDMINDPIDYAMVESIHKLVTLHGKKTIAEYVESREIIQQLVDIGIDYMQGYAIGKPSPLIVEAEVSA